MTPRFRSVVLDADSTLSGVEGIDWLAGQRGPEVARAVELATRRAMEGVVPLDAVYAERLALIRPTRDEIARLGAVYVRAMAPDTIRSVERMTQSGVRVVIVSGGLRDALLPMATVLGIPATDVHAVRVTYDASDAVESLDGVQPLATAAGKPLVVRGLRLEPLTLAVGDGMTDAAIRPVVAAFAVYTAYARRETVIAQADHCIDSFTALVRLVLP